MLEFLLNGFVTLFVIIDPPGLAPIFLALTHDWGEKERAREARKGTIVAGVTLIAFAILGEWLLGALGIAVAAFRVAGGILLFLLAIEMIFGQRPNRRERRTEDEKDEGREDLAVFPLGIPLIAGPGALTSITLLKAETNGDLTLQLLVIGVLLAVLLLTYLTLRAAGRITGVLGKTGTNVAGRVLGIILAALAVQFVLSGLRESFPGWA